MFYYLQTLKLFFDHTFQTVVISRFSIHPTEVDPEGIKTQKKRSRKKKQHISSFNGPLFLCTLPCELCIHIPPLAGVSTTVCDFGDCTKRNTNCIWSRSQHDTNAVETLGDDRQQEGDPPNILRASRVPLQCNACRSHSVVQILAVLGHFEHSLKLARFKKQLAFGRSGKAMKWRMWPKSHTVPILQEVQNDAAVTHECTRDESGLFWIGRLQRNDRLHNSWSATTEGYCTNFRQDPSTSWTSSSANMVRELSLTSAAVMVKWVTSLATQKHEH